MIIGRLVNKINDSYEPIGFLALKRLSDTHIRILVAVFTNAFLIVDSSYSKFLQLIEKTKNNNGTVPLHEDCSRNDNLSRLHKQLQMVAAQYFVDDDTK